MSVVTLIPFASTQHASGKVIHPREAYRAASLKRTRLTLGTCKLISALGDPVECTTRMDHQSNLDSWRDSTQEINRKNASPSQSNQLAVLPTIANVRNTAFTDVRRAGPHHAALSFANEVPLTLAIALLALMFIATLYTRKLRRRSAGSDNSDIEVHSMKELLTETNRVAKIGGWSLDLRDNIPKWSPEVCRIHEVPEDFAPDLDEAIAFYAPSARPILRAEIERAIATGSTWDLELPFTTAKGNHRIVRAIGKPVFEDNKCVKLWGALQDVTDAAIARSNLEALQAKFERATNGASDGLWEYEPLSGRVWYSDQFKRLVGLTESQFDSFSPTLDALTDRLHPDDHQSTIDAMQRHIEQEQPYDIKFRLRHESGEYRWFRMRGRAMRSENGNAISISGSITDIHDQFIAESRLDLATRAAGIGLWDWDIPSGETYFSDTFYTMLGYQPAELPMNLNTWKMLCHPDDIDAAFVDINRHINGETKQYVNEHRLHCKDGSWRWIRDLGEIVERNDDGSAKRMIGVHVDIQALRDALDRANSASMAKSEFLANMSHEIRTPMTAILGFSELVESEHETGNAMGPASESVAAIRSNARYLMTVIDDILDMSKIEAGKLTVENVPTNPAQVIEEACGLVRNRLKDKGVALSIVKRNAIPEFIVCDPTRMRQIVLNLLGNAIKFTDEGSITISLQHKAAEHLLEISVADTGIGMTPEQCARVAKFEPFTQADTSTTRNFGGTGLGLRICKALCGLLGGEIDVRSTEGEGSTFTFTVATGLDRQDANVLIESDTSASTATKPATPLVGTDERPLEGVRILLAEDGVDNQRLISLVLKKAGANVTVAENGKIAIDHILNANDDTVPNVVLMDMQMPVMDGYTATDELRRRGVDIPIIALTAHAMGGDRQKCIDAGCCDYQTKPIDRPALIECCRNWATVGCRSDECASVAEALKNSAS